MTQTSGNIYRIPRHFNWFIVTGGFALLSLVLMLGRWGGDAGAAQGYYETGLWLRHEVPLSALHAPYAYRLGVPALAAFIPGELHHVFGLLNWIFVTVGACLATATVRRLGFGTQRALAAGLLLILSLPTVWYAPTPVADAGALCLRMLFVFGVLTGKPRVMLAAGLAATCISEENILLLGWLLATERVERRRGWAAVAAAGAWLIVVREWVAPGLPGATWLPGVDETLNLLTDWRGLLALVACAGFALPLALKGMRDAPPRLAPLRGLLKLMAVPVLVALFSVPVQGCIVWSLYPFLIPFAVAIGLPQRVEVRPEARQLRLVRGA